MKGTNQQIGQRKSSVILINENLFKKHAKILKSYHEIEIRNNVNKVYKLHRIKESQDLL